MTVLTSPTLVISAMILLATCSLLGVTNPIYALYDTFYSPEDRFSIDYAIPPNSSILNITKSRDGVNIDTGVMIIDVAATTNPKYKDLSELAVYSQKHMQGLGDHVRVTSHPILVDDGLGYSFTTPTAAKGIDGPVLQEYIYAQNGDKTYLIQLVYHVSHLLLATDDIDHTRESIKFFR